MKQLRAKILGCCILVISALVSGLDVTSEPAIAQGKVPVSTATERGLHTATFELPQGSVTVNMPDDMAAGDVISGTVIAEPSGKNETERARNQDELSGYVVDIEKQRTPVARNVFRWIVPPMLGGALTHVILKNPIGKEIERSAIPVQPKPPGMSGESVRSRGLSGPQDFRLPRIGQTGRPVQIPGLFDGDFGTTQVRFGGQEARVLAESPRKVVAQSPRNIVGPTEIEFRERGVTARGSFRNVAVRLSVPKTTLNKGEQTTLAGRVDGLQDLEKAIALRLENRTPGVVSMTGGDVQTISIHPENVELGGTFSFNAVLRGSRLGGFIISAEVADLVASRVVNGNGAVAPAQESEDCEKLRQEKEKLEKEAEVLKKKAASMQEAAKLAKNGEGPSDYKKKAGDVREKAEKDAKPYDELANKKNNEANDLEEKGGTPVKLKKAREAAEAAKETARKIREAADKVAREYEKAARTLEENGVPDDDPETKGVDETKKAADLLKKNAPLKLQEAKEKSMEAEKKGKELDDCLKKKK